MSTDQEVIRIEASDLAAQVKWGTVVDSIINSVNYARYNGKSPVVQVPQFFYDDLLMNWACVYTISMPIFAPPVPLPRSLRWIDRILGWFNLSVIRHEMTPAPDVQICVEEKALRKFHADMVEKESLVVNGLYVPVVGY